MSSRTQRAVKGGVTGLMQHFVNMLFQVIMTPLILAQLGQETLGGYAVVLQIFGYSILLDFGFAVALGRYLAQAHGPEIFGNRFSELLTVGRNVLFLTNLLVSTLLVLTAWNIQLFLAGSTAIHADAQLALYLMAVWSIARTPLYIYSSALIATQDLAALNLIAICVNLVRLLAALGFVYLGFGLPGLVGANILAELIGGCVQWFIFHRRHPRYRAGSGLGNIGLGKEMMRFGFGYWGVNLSVVLLLGSDNLIAGALYGGTAASVFYTTKMFASLLIALISRMIDNASPGINQIIGTGDFIAVKQVYLRLFRYLLLLALPAAIGTVIFLESLVSLWVGSEQFGGQYMAMALALFVFVQVMAHLNGITALALGQLRHWPTISVISGVIAVLGAYFLGKQYGMAWIPLSMALATTSILLFLSRLVARQLEIGIKDFMHTIRPALYATVPLLLISGMHSTIRHAMDWFSLGLVLGSFILIWLGASWIFGLNANERIQIRRMIKLH